jgi:uncharacterized damage-inducible protein DinB
MTQEAPMITDMASYLRFFDSVRRRTERDVAALPPEAAAWRPPAIDGEAGWDIGRIVRHICGSREYFASAYRGEGWIAQLVPEPDGGERESWVPLLRASAETYMAALRDTPDEWLRRKVEMIDTAGALSGWRILMMMIEHEVHHRSQIDSYAGLQGWPVPDIFGRSAESIGDLQATQRARYRD